MFFSFLEGGAANNNGGNQITMYILLGVLVVALVAMIIVSSMRNKKSRQEAEKLVNSVRPGNKVKTIGGVCGIVVEVDAEEGTFVLETGSETSGKCYMKFDKQAIYQTDAVTDGAKEEEKPLPVEEPVSEEKTEEAAAPAEKEEKTEE